MVCQKISLSLMECLKMITVSHGEGRHRVPCGRCAFCLSNKRAQWMFRVHHEMSTQEYPGWFLTLTYDERHVRRTATGRLSLRFRDIQLFCKRLRKAKYYLKYIIVGEYGTLTHRPHYHAILWTDASADVIQAQWKSSKDDTPLGSIHFGTLNVASAMYALKYIIQPKQRQEDGLERTRAQFSRGIGLGFLTTSMYTWLTEDYENPKMVVKLEGKKVALPRYYKNKIYTKHQMRKQQSKTKWDSIRKRRVYMRELIALGVKNTKKYIDGLRVIENNRIISNTKYGTHL